MRWSFRTLAENEPWLRSPPLCSRFFSTWCGRSGHGRPTPTERRPARKRRARERRSSAPSSKPSDSETKVYSGRKKKFYFVFFVFFERHFRFSFVCIFAIGCWNEEGRVARKRMMIFHFAWRRRNKSTSTFHLVSLCLNFYWIQIFYLIPVVAPKKRNKPIFSWNQNRPVGRSK